MALETVPGCLDGCRAFRLTSYRALDYAVTTFKDQQALSELNTATHQSSNATCVT